MDRYKIYSRYIVLNSLYADKVGEIEDQNGFINYTFYRTKDNGIEFATATINQRYEVLADNIDENGDNIVEMLLEHDVYDMPVIAFTWGYGCLRTTRDTVVFDFSKCDLSNLLELSFSGLTALNSANMEFNWYVKLPTLESKRLKPISISKIFGNRVKHVFDSVLMDIDLSEVRVMSNLFMNSDLEEFDFSKYSIKKLKSATAMFKGCKELKRVLGYSVGKLVEAYFMFAYCENLEYISPDIFEDSKLISTGNIMCQCRKLKNIPICIQNINAGLDRSFSMCDSIDTVILHKFLAECYKKGIKLSYPLEKCSGTYIAGATRMETKCLFEILQGTSYTIIDIAKVEFIGGEEGVRSVFGYDSISVEYSIPKVMIINSSLSITDMDREVFHVVDMRGQTEDDIDLKIKLILMVSHTNDGKYIVIV